MRRFLLVVTLTDDGMTGEADQVNPEYLWDSALQAGEYLEAHVEMDSGITLQVLLAEELLP